MTWSHYRLLIRVKSEEARSFYADECVKAGWSVRQLERQINSFFYERLLSSRDKEGVSKEIFAKEPSAKPEDFIKDPYVLEFIGVKQDASVYEKDIETALINELQKFLLELGRGFSFVARQKHIDMDGEHFYIDLVFYNDEIGRRKKNDLLVSALSVWGPDTASVTARRCFPAVLCSCSIG